VQIIKELDLKPLTECVFDLKDVAAAFEMHLSGKYPKVLVRCNDLD
jgi:(R,R)-butanediol dehydrogenase/meso-butanediol dehydrogenase/diacetyl reductase/L-iditol 2-dehydrogenase